MGENVVLDFKNDFMARGDGVSDDSKSWSDAMAYFNKVKSGTLIIPEGVYRIGKQVINDNPSDGIPYATLEYGDLTLSGIDGLTIQGKVSKDGKPLSIFKYHDNIKYGYFNPDNGGKPLDVNKDSQAIGGAIFTLGWNCKNITIKDLELDGNITNGIYNPAPAGKKGVDIIFIGLSSYGAENLLIQNVYVHHFGLDGFYIQTSREILPEGKFHTVMENCRSEYNGRQGLSFTVGSGLKVINSKFLYTGMGGIRISPGANIDIENHDKSGAPLSNSLFKDCIISSNKGGSGSVNLAGKVDNIRFSNCTIDAGDMVSGTNRFYAVQMNFSPSRNVTFDDCTIRGVFLMYQKGNKKMDEEGKTILNNCIIKDNLPITETKIQQPLIDIYDKIEFNNCKFYVHPARQLFRSTPLAKDDQHVNAVQIRKGKVYNLKTGKADKTHLKSLSNSFRVISN